MERGRTATQTGSVRAEMDMDDIGNSGGQGWLQSQFRNQFKKETLARELHFPQITGIAFSGAVGIGLFVTCANIITMSGPVGAVISFSLAGLVIISVMRSLAEMVSVRPVKGGLMDYPATFIDPALGPTIGIMYWFANCMSMVTLTVQSALLFKYWAQHLELGWIVLALLCCMLMLNCFGVRLYGTLECIFMCCKVLIIVSLCLLMIAIKAGAGPKKVTSGDYTLAPGYNATAFNPANSTYPYSRQLIDRPIDIGGVGGRLLAIWTCTTSAMFQFMGGDIVLMTAAEAKSPRKQLPKAARFMYLLPVSFYLVAIILVGLNLNYLDPNLTLPYRTGGLLTTKSSPFILPISYAGILGLPGFFNACFIFSALTAANSALYVCSRTLFLLARSSRYARIRNSLGKTNNGNTPLAAIICSIVPGSLAFLAVHAGRPSFAEPMSVLGRLYTGSMLCIYGTECLAFLRFQRGMKWFYRFIDRDSKEYESRHYRAKWQPIWAIIGLVACTLLMIFSGWSSIYAWCKLRRVNGKEERDISRGDAAFDIVATYLGPFLFFSLYAGCKWVTRSRIVQYGQLQDVWTPADVPDEDPRDDDESSLSSSQNQMRRRRPRVNIQRLVVSAFKE